MKGMGITTATLAAVAALAAPSVANANPNLSSKSECGLHAGKVLRRDSGGTVYRFRVGVRSYTSGGSMECKGKVRPPGSKAGDITNPGSMQPFSLPSFNYFFAGRVAIDSSLTAYGCKQFGGELAATLITEGAATPALVIGGAGCAWGVFNLGQLLPSGTVNLHGMTITAPRR